MIAPDRLREVFDTVERMIEDRWEIPVTISDVPNPFTGDLDGNVLAYEAASGKELWRSATGKAIGGGVITYQANGRQHVAVAAGLNSPLWQLKGGSAQVAVYALP